VRHEFWPQWIFQHSPAAILALAYQTVIKAALLLRRRRGFVEVVQTALGITFFVHVSRAFLVTSSCRNGTNVFLVRPTGRMPKSTTEAIIFCPSWAALDVSPSLSSFLIGGGNCFVAGSYNTVAFGNVPNDKMGSCFCLLYPTV